MFLQRILGHICLSGCFGQPMSPALSCKPKIDVNTPTNPDCQLASWTTSTEGQDKSKRRSQLASGLVPNSAPEKYVSGDLGHMAGEKNAFARVRKFTTLPWRKKYDLIDKSHLKCVCRLKSHLKCVLKMRCEKVLLRRLQKCD